MKNHDPSAASPADEIVSSRVLDAPRDRVFDAFSDPDRLARWWGPQGFTNTIHEFQFRPGGRWRLTMRSPDGVDYENESVFTEIVPPARLVFDHLEPVHSFRMTIELAAEGAQTRVTWRMRFDDADEAARVRTFVAEANQQNLDRLARELERPAV